MSSILRLIQPRIGFKERWPKGCFDTDEQTMKDFENDSWFEIYCELENNMSHVLARKKSSSSVHGKQSEASSSSTTPSDQKQREIKSSRYKDLRYKTLLATKGSFMDDSDLGIIGKASSIIKPFLAPSNQFLITLYFATTYSNQLVRTYKTEMRLGSSRTSRY